MSYLQCPQCGSDGIELRDVAQRAGGTLGGLVGAAGGIAGALRGGRVGLSLGMAAGPVGASVGTIVGVVLGGLGGGALGTELGAIFGKVVDDRVLNNCRCTACGHEFSERRGSSEPPWSGSRPSASSSSFGPDGPHSDTDPRDRGNHSEAEGFDLN